VLEAAFVLLEFSSPSRRIFTGSHSLPPSLVRRIGPSKSQTESHKKTLANLQAARELKIARKAALEAELRSLSPEIEADDKKIAELPGLIENIQEEATSAIAKVNQCNAELTILSDA
jgi:chromosome segregation ATPase